MLQFAEINGYVRDEFHIVNKYKDQEYTGSVTDGKFRVEILISNVTEKVTFHQGKKLQIIGEIQEHGKNTSLNFR